MHLPLLNYIACNAAPPAIDETPVVAAVTEASTDAVKSSDASDFNELEDAKAVDAVEAVEAVEAVPAKVRGPARYAAVFLDEASQTLLKEKFPARFANEQYDHMTVHFAPSEEEREDINAVCGHTITLAVLGVAEDFYSQTVSTCLCLYCIYIEGDIYSEREGDIQRD
jgi:hypothetical protein